MPKQTLLKVLFTSTTEDLSGVPSVTYELTRLTVFGMLSAKVSMRQIDVDRMGDVAANARVLQNLTRTITDQETAQHMECFAGGQMLGEETMAI